MLTEEQLKEYAKQAYNLLNICILSATGDLSYLNKSNIYYKTDDKLNVCCQFVYKNSGMGLMVDFTQEHNLVDGLRLVNNVKELIQAGIV